MNKVILSGTVASQVQVFEKNTKMTSFSLATKSKYTPKDGGLEKVITDYHRICCFGESNITAENLKEGDMIAIEGALKTRSYEKDNIKRNITEVIVAFKRSIEVIVKSDGNVSDVSDVPF